jgi:beta-glucosidase
VGFRKVFVEAGESQPVRITVDPAGTNHPFGVWDYCTRDFVTAPGTYTVYVGTSADNTPHTATLTVE